MADVSDKTGEEALNNFNISMRSKPWFVQWHEQRGLSPSGYQNRKLSGKEQDELEGLLVQHEFKGQKPKGMTIDSGGSLNQHGGWKGMPTWAKVAIIAGATIATAGAAGAFSAGGGIAGGAGGAGGAAGSTGAAAATTGAATTAGVTGTAAATGGGLTGWGTLAAAAKNPAVWKAGANMLTRGSQSEAANRGTALEAGLDRDRIATDRGQLDIQQQGENRDERESAWKMLQRIAYAREQANPERKTPSYLPEKYYNANAVRRTSQTELDGADGLEKELMARLQGGPRSTGLPPLTDVAAGARPSAFERIAGYGGAAMNLYGNLRGRNGEAVDDDPWRE